MIREEQVIDQYEYWLSGLVFLSGRKKIILKELFGEAKSAYRADLGEIEKTSVFTDREKEKFREAQKQPEDWLKQQIEACAQQQIGLSVWQDERYPKRLQTIYNPPYGLFYRGMLPANGQTAVGIVGARNCSYYGKITAEKIGQRLAREGIAVVSGMAAGIDSSAQRGAVQAGGYSCGVLGCGPDICYPAGNRELYGQLKQNGCLLSEYPPGTRPLAMYFPQRNRIISGLSDLVLVVEAKERSGSLITADFALEQGKDIYAVPGRVCDPLSQGTNRLIRQGAGIFLNMEDFLNEMHIFSETEENSFTKQKVPLEKLELLVYSCLGFTPKGMEEILTAANLPLGVLIETLEALREKGCAAEVYKNYYVRLDVFG